MKNGFKKGASYGNLSLTEALISIARFLVGNLKKIRRVSIRPKGRQEQHTDRIQKKMRETIWLNN
jgi:hypothetical protein